ncbi:type II toxin-antitoxin system death-on-curing family toxin [Paraburkholderia sp. 32]|uniref:type II toxin-antitoxin system death-on-curing family toxin n=1 Tax=Paraburkholderia sp. 32 TaxID=2991057 RepID=UPI003D232F0A
MVQYLSAEDILYIHDVLVVVFENDGDPISPAGARNEGSLVESAANRPKTALGSTEKYRTVVAKAAALFHSLVKNHAFHNGNKRTALVSMIRFLDLNNMRIIATDQDLFDLVTNAAKGNLPGSDNQLTSDNLVAGIEEWLAKRCVRTVRASGDVRVKNFLEKVKLAGGRVKESADKHAWIVYGPLGKPENVRIPKSTSKISGMVARIYSRRIGFTDGKSGISFDDLSAGVQPEQRIIGDLIEVLRWLAHT